MLVYSSNFEFESSTSIEKAIQLIAKWVTQRSNTHIDPVSFQNGFAKRRLNDGSVLTSCTTKTNEKDIIYPYLFSTEFSHGDDKVAGRMWIMGIGLRQLSNNSPVECTFLLKTDEISPRVNTPILTTRPRIVWDIFSACKASGGSVGLSVKQLDEPSALAFLAEVERENRVNPIVVISTKRDGGYFVEPEKLRLLLIGIADVVQIPLTVDTFTLERILGQKYSAWGGAVNILSRLKHGRNGNYCESSLYLPDRMKELVDSGVDIYSEILLSVTHQANVPASWRHISIQMVEQVALQNKLKFSIEEAASAANGASYIPLLESAMDQLTEKDRTIENLRLETEIRDEQIQSLESQVQGLKYSLVGRQHSGAVLDAADLGAIKALRESLGIVLDHEPSLEQSLSIIQMLFPDRVIVLDSAFDSARESKGFRYGRKGFDLLWALASEYWTAINNGGDLEGKRVLGEKYAQNEGNELTTPGRRRRTFDYKGRDITMEKHLKLGNKDSISETLRIHFEWLSDEKIIVIGHCGKHLDR